LESSKVDKHVDEEWLTPHNKQVDEKIYGQLHILKKKMAEKKLERLKKK
jgi:hypothetical protein